MTMTPDARTRAHDPYAPSAPGAALAFAGAATPPDTPRPVAEQFARTYPFVPTEPGPLNIAAIQANNARAWRPACWHKPLDRWWVGDLPILPLPVAERWATFAPQRARSTPPRPVSAWNARPAPATPEEIALLHAASRARAAARGKREFWEEEA